MTTLAYKRDNALNAICPYFTMFPLEYPLKVLKNHKRDRPVILDPFCGRGTTLYAARQLGLDAWGIDSSPIATAIARAKLASCDANEPIELAAECIANTVPADIPDTPFFRAAYHPDTLHDICALREFLQHREHETCGSTILRAAVLGCLHGPLPKNLENASYFSNQMPRTYSSKPDYAVRFWRHRGLQPPNIDVLAVLRRKIKRLHGLEREVLMGLDQVIEGDARSKKSYEEITATPSVVVTSPPYYGMRTYVQDQWLRNWFLGGPSHVDYLAGTRLDHRSPRAFSESLGSVWANVAAISTENLHMYVRFGIIPSIAVDAKMILRESLDQSEVKWRVISVRTSTSVPAGRRQAQQMKTRSKAALEFDFHVERL